MQRNPIYSVFILATVVPAFGQYSFERDFPRPDVRNLSPRLAASDLVLVGTVVKFESVHPRPENRSPNGIQRAPLYTIRVDSHLCRKSDFLRREVPETADTAREVYLFIHSSSRRENRYRNIQMHSVGTRYLWFLRREPEEEEVKAFYELDPQLTYYRTLDAVAGAIELPTEGQPFKPAGYSSDTDLATPVLNAATALCQAVQPSNFYQKIDGLERLKSSPDLAMRENADAAIKLIDPSR